MSESGDNAEFFKMAAWGLLPDSFSNWDLTDRLGRYCAATREPFKFF